MTSETKGMGATIHRVAINDRWIRLLSEKAAKEGRAFKKGILSHEINAALEKYLEVKE